MDAGVVETEKRALTGLSLGALTSLLESRTRALAVLRWLYAVRPIPEVLPESIPGVGRAWMDVLRAHCRLPELRVVERHASSEGTVKTLFAVPGAQIEAVLIPAKGRSTVCISSQSGCTRNCAFCATATLGFGRNLAAHELVAQYWRARVDAPADAPASNVVFMGMGEPMDNLDAVLEAVELLTQTPAPQLGAAQVTVSTSGVLPGMVRFLAESRASLALSLNASHDAQRAEIMVQTKAWPIGALMGALKDDARTHPKRHHFIEYVLLAGFNDTDADAERLIALLQGVNARVNLIPHNAFAGNLFAPPSRERVLAFQARVAAAGLMCLVRWPRGREISAACGQLARTVPSSAVRVSSAP